MPVPTSFLGFFQLFFTRELLRFLAEEINMYTDAAHPGQAWNMCSDSEMAKFLGLIFLMELNRKPTLRHYWTKDPFNHMPIYN